MGKTYRADKRNYWDRDEYYDRDKKRDKKITKHEKRVFLSKNMKRRIEDDRSEDD